MAHSFIDVFNPGCPLISLGTSDSSVNVLKFGIQCGFRVIDVKHDEDSERHIASVLSPLFQGGFIQRCELFICYSMTFKRKTDYLEVIRSKLKEIDLQYFDIFVLVQSPWVEDNLIRIWRTLEQAVMSKIIRNIGISGFLLKCVDNLLKCSIIKPFAVYSVLNPYRPENELLQFCQSNDLLVVALSPFDVTRSGTGLLREPIIMEIAEHYKVTPGQVILAWALHRQTVPVTHTLKIEHAKQNIMLSDMKLTEKDMKDINSLSKSE